MQYAQQSGGVQERKSGAYRHTYILWRIRPDLILLWTKFELENWYYPKKPFFVVFNKLG